MKNKWLWILFVLVMIIVIIMLIERKKKSDGKSNVRKLSGSNNGALDVFLIGNIDYTTDANGHPQGVASFDKTYNDVQSVVIKSSKQPVMSTRSRDGIPIDQMFYPVSALILSNGRKKLLFGGRYVAAEDLE